jgi:hypothetical protein
VLADAYIHELGENEPAGRKRRPIDNRAIGDVSARYGAQDNTDRRSWPAGRQDHRSPGPADRGRQRSPSARASSRARRPSSKNTEDLFDDVSWARIFAGFHYRHSMVDGGKLGRQVARQLLRRHFRRLRHEPSSEDE